MLSLKHLPLLIQLVTLILTASALYFALDKRLAVIESRLEGLPHHVQEIDQRLSWLEGARVSRQRSTEESD